MNKADQMKIAETRAVEDASMNKEIPCSIRSFVIESFRQNIDEASDDVVKWLRKGEIETDGLMEEVMESINMARAKLDELPENGAERWTTTLKSLSGVWRRLRAATTNARAEFDRQATEKSEALIHQKNNNRPMFLR